MLVKFELTDADVRAMIAQHLNGRLHGTGLTVTPDDVRGNHYYQLNSQAEAKTDADRAAEAVKLAEAETKDDRPF